MKPEELFGLLFYPLDTGMYKFENPLFINSPLTPLPSLLCSLTLLFPLRSLSGLTDFMQLLFVENLDIVPVNLNNPFIFEVF